MPRRALSGVEALESRTLLASVAIEPTADTFVRNNAFRTTNYGESPLLWVKNADESSNARAAFLKFDLGDVGGGDVDRAVLRINGALTSATAGPAEVGVYNVEDVDWVEGNGQIAYRNRTDGTVDTTRHITGHGDGYDRDGDPGGEMTWNTQPAFESNPAATFTVAGDLYQTYEIDLTEYVRAARADGNNTVSLALNNPTSEAALSRFLSREFPGGSPQLVVTTGGQAVAPTASVDVENVTAAGDEPQAITVAYSGEAVDAERVSPADLVVLGPNGGPVEIAGATAATGEGGTVVATYTVAAPGGDWDSADNGIYRVTINPAAVVGAGGESVGALAEFRVAVGDTTAPTARIIPTNVTAEGTTYSFSVEYTDDVAIDVGTINLNNFEVDAPDGSGLGFTSVTVTPDENAQVVTATYTTEAPGGPGNIGWRSDFDGDWNIILRENQVYDTAGNTAPRTEQAFRVDIGASDTAGPTATIDVNDVTAPGGEAHVVRVDYDDPAGIDLTSLGTGDISVTGPGEGGAALRVTGFTLAGGSGDDDGPRGVNYTFAAPGGTWDEADRGTYTVRVKADEVRDTNGNAAGEVSETFTADPVSPDTRGPTASIAVGADITAAGDAAQTVTVAYTDDVAVDVATIGTDDLTVSGPAGELTVGDLDVTAGSPGAPVIVSYTVAAPAGGWNATHSGTYDITLNTDSVRDTSGNAAQAASAEFDVAITGGDTNPSDPTFESQTVQFTAQAVATQGDGKIVIAGYAGNPTNGGSRAVLERRNPDGTVDTSFGSGGQIISPEGAADAYFAVIVHNNRIITAGTRGGDMTLTAYNTTGGLDATFAGGGIAQTDFGSNDDAAFGLAVAPDNKLVAAGGSGGNFAVVRFSADGAIDPTFAQGGRQLFGVGEESGGLGAVAVQGDGKVVAVGARGAAVAVVRLGTNGEADPSFSGDGVVLVGGLTAARQDDSPFADRSQAVALQGNGNIIVSNRTPDGDFGLARVTPAGNLDSTFGENGLAVADFGGEADVDALVLQATGQILAVGTALIDNRIKTGVAAFDADGRLITGFGEQGKITVDTNLVPLDRELRIGDLVVRAFGTRQPDGRLVLGASNRAPNAATTSTLSRLVVPGSSTRALPTETPLGTFGLVEGRKTPLTFDFNGTAVTLNLNGATGTAFRSDNAVRLSIADPGPGAKLVIKTKGGGGRVTVSDVNVTGQLKSMVGKTTDVTGSVFATGPIGKVALGNVSGTIASASGFIGNVSALNLSGARILSGANLGADGRPGGTGGDADAYAPGSIGVVKVAGAITGSVIGAGANAGDDNDFFDDDNMVSGGPGSTIRSIVARSGADANSRFYAGVFRTVKLPAKVVTTSDPRFKTA